MPSHVKLLLGQHIGAPSKAVVAVDDQVTAGDLMAEIPEKALGVIEIRSASGLGGKAFVTMTGDVGSVEASVAAGVQRLGDSGHVVIPSPSQELKQKLT